MHDVLLFAKTGAGAPRNRTELLALLPNRDIVDRLVVRYFSSSSPSQRMSFIPRRNDLICELRVANCELLT